MTLTLKGAYVLLPALAMFMAGLSAAFANDDEAAKASTHAQQAHANLPAFSKTREAAAIVFVKQHKPELLDLLKMVAEKNTAEYQRAIRLFFDWSEKVANAKGQDHGSIALALEAWQAKIQTQILGAQILRKPDNAGELKEQLKQVIAHSVDVQIAQVAQQIAQAEQQLETLRKQKETLTSNREHLIQQQLAAMDQLVAKHREGGGLQAEFEPIVRKIQDAAQQRQQEGGDVSEVAALMEKIGPLLREGKVDEARALLKKAGELLKK
jgi:hypothetical protein